MSSRDLMGNIESIGSKMVLCTFKYAKSIDFMLNIIYFFIVVLGLHSDISKSAYNIS
jgi:hypothetical protein